MKNISISKKFLIFFSLMLSLLFINSNNVKAYYEETDTIYSSTLKFNADDYYQDNLFYYDIDKLSYNNNQAYDVSDGNIAYWTGYTKINNYIPIESNTNYKISVNLSNNWTTICFYDNNFNFINGVGNGNGIFTTPNNSKYFRFATSGLFNTWNNITLVKGNELPNNYIEPFKFGYMVSNNQSNAFTLEFIDNYNNNNTYTLTNNSSVYLPFQYLNKEVTFSYNVNQNVSSNITTDVNITFTPIFSGTLKSNNSNVLKSTFTYVYNYIYYKNFKLSSYQNIYLDDMLEINYPTTNKDSKALTLTSVISPNNVISNFTSDIKQTNVIDQDTYFNGTNSIYKFNLVTYMYTNNNGLLYSINFESINLGVVNSSVSNSFPTNTDNDLEIYNTCSGNIFQDFNCNVTNAVTWTIFNIPIIGPLIGFISNLIQLISQLVSALEWYESLGILFSIFILIMFIKILGILWKGKDE